MPSTVSYKGVHACSFVSIVSMTFALSSQCVVHYALPIDICCIAPSLLQPT